VKSKSTLSWRTWAPNETWSIACRLFIFFSLSTTTPHVISEVPKVNNSEASQSVTVSQEKLVQTESKATSKKAPIIELSIKLESNNEPENKILIELFPEKAPQHVNQFLRLVNEGFYDGLIFHRVIPNFVIQAGGYDSELKYFSSEQKIINESFNGLKNAKHTVAMARLSKPDSADTQFFINLRDNNHLDSSEGNPGYTVFGKVIDGFEVVEEIELQDTESREGFFGLPVSPVTIIATKTLDL
jgi:cyclophilin family peptidyl-prolyl cis-trans isomerase